MRVVTAPVPADVPTLPPVGPDTVAAHLIELHAVAPAVLAGVDVEDVLGWHAAEHRHRTPSNRAGPTTSRTSKRPAPGLRQQERGTDQPGE